MHPAGTVGLHIHRLDAVTRGKVVWHIGLQDVLSTGRLFETGRLDVGRVVSIGGPPVIKPRLIRTRIGAAVASLMDGEINDVQDIRVISGSVLSGRRAEGDVHGFLGRYHQQISVLVEGRTREFLGWLAPGSNKFSTIRTFVERAEELGCLELDEEDLALCTFVDPGKTDFSPHLRRVLDILEKEG